MESSINLARCAALSGSLLLASSAVAQGKLDVHLSPVELTGQKAVVKLEMINHLAEPVVGARAICFVSDAEGKVVGQGSRWVIGGSSSTNRVSLVQGGTNVFHFVVGAGQPWASTNLTAKLVFSKVLLQSGKTADARKDVSIHGFN